MKRLSRNIFTNPLCEECNKPLFLIDGELVCGHCGLVIDTYEERVRAGIRSSDSSSPGFRFHLIDGLGSFMDFRHTSYFCDRRGEPLSPNLQFFYSRLKRLYDRQERFGRYGGTNYRTLFSLSVVTKNLGLPSIVRDKAAYLYRRIISGLYSKKRERPTSILIAAYCLLQAIREFCSSNPITIQVIAREFRKLGHRVTPSSIIRAGIFCRDAGLMPKIRRSEEYVKMLVERIISTSLTHKSPKVDFSILKGSLLKTALMLLAKVKRITRAGHSPYVLAVSAIYAAERYLAKKENRRHILTQGFLAKITEASEYSIRENYCHFFKRLVEKD